MYQTVPTVVLGTAVLGSQVSRAIPDTAVLGAANDSALAFTGIAAGTYVVLAIGLLTVGAAFRFMARRVANVK